MKRALALLLSAILLISCMSVVAFAANKTWDLPLKDSGSVVDEDGDSMDNFTLSQGHVFADSVPPGKTFYIPIDENATIGMSNGTVDVKDLFESDDFNFRLDRDKNGKYLDTVKFVWKRFNGNREPYIEVELKDNDMTDDDKLTFDVYFRARKTAGNWKSGDTANVRFELWLENEKTDGDAWIEAGEGIVYSPTSNDDNVITWGGDYDIASLEFEADDDADDFFAKLSTKAVRWVYEDFGDPVDAELYFRTFTASPKIDSTSRAKLTLYDPFDNDYYYDRHGRYYDGVDPYSCYIYLVGSSGELTDITDRFTYVGEDETEAGAPGWQAKVRTLGSYVISDTELDLERWEEEEPWIPTPEAPPSRPTVQPGSPINPAPTGSHDYVKLAAFLAAASLAAAAISRKRR